MQIFANEKARIDHTRYTDRHKELLKQTIVRLDTTTTTETTEWIPRDTYAQAVFMAMHAGRVLGSLAAAVRHDIEAGRGDTIRVRTFVRRSAQGPVAENVALTSNKSAMDTADISIDAYGDYDTLTGRAIDYTTDNVRSRLLTAMGNALEEKLEEVVYEILKDETATREVDVQVGGELSYEDVLAAQAELKKAVRTGALADQHGPYNPDFLVVGPDHEKQLLLDDALTKTVDYGPGTVALPGEIGRIGQIRILVHPLANESDATADAVQGIMLDSSRAFGEAFGRPLTFEEDRVAESDTWKQVAWVFYGSATIDPAAICHLKNASA